VSTAPAYQLDGHDAGREAFYATACDPRRHVVVEACAGAGKTWMLVARIVRALLDGAEPQEILAITFTRKAAGEMRTRLADWLREFSALTPEAAADKLRLFGLSADEAARRAPALIGLHERVLTGGRAVEVRTFHAWYAQLLRAAPIEMLASLGLAPGLSTVEDIDELKPELMQAFHRALLGDPAALADFRRLSTRRGRSRLDAWFDTALARRSEIELADEAGTLADAIEPPADRDPLRRVGDAGFVDRSSALARALAARGAKLSDDAARGMVSALACADLRQRYDGLRVALFTEKGQGTPRKQLGNLPEQAALCEALDEIAALLAHEQAHDDHAAMVRLTRTLFAEYAALKRRRGLIDMADLERVAFALLSDHTLSGWVQERLDARVRHLLIDEFQDTSPLQWQALHAWLAAYAGAGGGPEAPRLFIVGDPKQSIYRFRRAEPRVFEAAQRFVVDALGGTLAACDHTRRCAPGVVGVINQVFGRLAAEGRLATWREHSTEVAEGAETGPALRRLPSAERAARAARGATEDAQPVWRPSLTVPRVEARSVLREVEAGALALAIDALVHDEGVAPRQIFVLARTRAVLATAADALAALHLPHVAPEGLSLGDLPEVQDLLAVLDVLASTGQALSLARALKSPLFGATDADLLWLARRARDVGGWWPALMQRPAGAPATLQRAAALFAMWQAASDTLPPHDLLDRIVHEGDWLPRLAAVVPPERHARAMGATRALLACALELDDGRYASPYGFVRALRQRRVEVPSVQTQDAVQLLTIHGAKGLEAEVVFLMDADPKPPEAETATLLVDWPVEAPRPRRVAFLASEGRCPPPLQALLAEEQAARAREELNALYVALTRAQRRLVVSRTPPVSSGEAPSWWARLEGLAKPWQPPASPHPAGAATHAEVVALPLARRRAEAPAAPPTARDDAAARLGQAVHRMLEWAAQHQGADRAALAQAAARAFAVPDADEVLRTASTVLDSPACRRFFDPAAIAWAGNEVPVPGTVGEVRRIDRLVRLAGADAAWWVLDYKLAGAPQHDAAYREQLAAYRDAVATLAPGEHVRAAFVTGRGELIELDG
jgi:ATP-dependent helicase/nuclease subunit A